MAKLVINAERKLSHINKELQGHFSEHLEGVSMRDCMWEKILKSRTSTGCVPMWWKP